MKIYGQLESAQLECLSADPTGCRGRTYWNTVLGAVRVYTGAGWITVTPSTSAPTSVVTGARGAPIAITAAGGITPGGFADEVVFIKGTAGVTVTKNPQIVAGTQIGQTLELWGTSDTDYLQVADGTGLDLNGGWRGATNSVLGLRWDGFNWCERYRR